jgi:hypothetical protein
MADSQEKMGEGGQKATGKPRQAETYTELQNFLLGRMQRLIYIKNNYDMRRFRRAWLQRALDRAIYSTLRDSIEADVGEQAKAILRQEHHRN